MVLVGVIALGLAHFFGGWGELVAFFNFCCPLIKLLSQEPNPGQLGGKPESFLCAMLSLKPLL